MISATTHEIIYRIDESDRLSYVSPGWVTFARHNGATDLTPDNILGHPFLRFISGAATQLLLLLILERVRQNHTPVEFPFRCDSTTLRRFMEVLISPLDQGSLEFRCRLIKEEPRRHAPLLEQNDTATDGFVSMCSWCKKVAIPSGQWLEVEEAVKELHLFDHQPAPQVTHGICRNCEQQVRARLNLSSPQA